METKVAGRIRFGRGRLALPAWAVLTALLACTSAPTPEVAVGTITVATPSPGAQTQSGRGGACSHDYFPSDEGATWETINIRDGADAYNAMATITESREDGFTLVSELADGSGTFTVEVSCTEDGLIMLDPLQQSASASVTSNGNTATVTTLAQTGVTLPADLEEASTWQRYVAWQVQGSGTVLHGDTTTEYVSRGLEIVTVPFGTFDAIRVDSETQGTLEGEDILSCQETVWYAKDVGVVKQEQNCSSYSGSSELVSFDSP